MTTLKSPIAIICLSPYSGGMELDAISLAKKLSNYSQVTVIAKSGYFIDNKRADYVDHNGIKLETISFKNSLSLNIILHARSIIQEYRIKNVIFFGASELKSLYFSFLRLDINLIVRHGTTKSRPKKDWFHKLIYSRVNYHVSICKHLETNVKYIIPFGKKTRSKLIYPSFSFDEPKHVKHNKLILLHVGRIAKGKGQMDATQACDILVKNGIDFEFNIVGGFDDSYEKEFLEFYENCDYKEKIRLIGFTNDVSIYLQTADIFFFPSHGEGLSNAFLEALSYNLVCISYNNTSFPELRRMGLYFKTCDDRNIQNLQKIIFDTVLNLKSEKQHSSTNHALVKKLFSLEEETSQYLNIIQ